MSGVDLKFCLMFSVDLGMRLSVSGGSGVSSVGSPILSVGVGRHKFWVECQCGVSEIPPSWALRVRRNFLSNGLETCPNLHF